MLQRVSMRRFASSTTTSPLSTLLAGFKPSAHHLLAGEISEQWMQGQTTFGGLSAALCLTGARQLIREAETQLPLRSAQIMFLGAAGGAVTIDGEVLRRGKSSAFVRSEVSSFGRVATSSTFAFCKSRPSQVDTSYICPPAMAATCKMQRLSWWLHGQRRRLRNARRPRIFRAAIPRRQSLRHRLRHQETESALTAMAAASLPL